MKIHIVTLGLLLFSLTVNAQNTYLGIKAGYTIASFKQEGDGTVSLNPLPGFTVGLVGSSEFENLPLGFSIEPGYVLKGSRINNDTLDYRFHYVNMPLLFEVYPIKRLKLSAGIEPAYLISAKNHVNDSTKRSLLDTYNRWEVSGVLGASFTPVYFLDIGFRYTTAFTKAAEQDAIIDRKNIYNQYLQFFVVFKIAN